MVNPKPSSLGLGFAHCFYMQLLGVICVSTNEILHSLIDICLYIAFLQHTVMSLSKTFLL